MPPRRVRAFVPDSMPTVGNGSGTDAALVAAAQRGDTDAFRQLHAQTAPRILAVCTRMTGDPARGAELMQDAFVRAWERLHTFRGESTFATWIHRVAVNVVLATTRTERRRDDFEQVAPLEEAPVGAGFGASNVSDRIDLERAIAQLPPNARTVFVLHDIEGYRHDEIAQIMDLAAGTVRAHLHRARQLLIEKLSS